MAGAEGKTDTMFLIISIIFFGDCLISFAVTATSYIRMSRLSYGSTPETERLYERALKLLEPDPSLMHNIYGSRAMSFHRAEDYRKAIKYYELSYRYDPKNISALSSIGYCNERLKEYDNALKYYEKYLKKGKPGSKGYRFVEESIAYIKQGRFMAEPASPQSR